jgi:uncharacterized RDD family membrane protein YckC
MNWYWVENNERRGPVNDDALQALVASGRIGSETLVWREGLAAWTPWRQLRPPEPAPAPAPRAPAPAPTPTPADEIDPAKTVALSSAQLMAAAAAAAAREPGAPRPAPTPRPGPSPAATVAADTEACTQCGRRFARDELMRFERDRVCAQCKPLYLQKLKEGVRPATQLAYAGFWIRFGAKFIDGLIVGVPILILAFFFMPNMLKVTPGQQPNLGATCLFELLAWGISIAYSVYFVGKHGATPGKMVLHLKIVRPDGGKVTYGRALGRLFAELLSGLILYIGYIMAAFDEEHRSLHDRICDTRVVYA